MKIQNPNQLLADLIMGLNSLEGKRFNKLRCIYKIYKFKIAIKRLVKAPYNGKKIYELLVFLNSAFRLSLLKSLDKNYISFDLFPAYKNLSIISGSITITISYNDRILKINYKSIVESDRDIIEMKWVVSDSDESRQYSTTTKELHNKIIPDDRMSETKQLEFNSAKILYNGIETCINIISKNLYDRYVR